MPRSSQKRPTTRRRKEVVDDYPEDRPFISFGVMSVVGLLILGAGVLTAWLLSGPDFERKETVAFEEEETFPPAQEPGAGLEVRRAVQVEGEDAEPPRAVPIDPTVVATRPDESVARALPVDAPVPDAIPVGRQTGVIIPDQIDVRLDSGENAAVQREVLRRIDAMPNISSGNKDKLYAQVNRTRGMGRLATISFGPGQTAPGPEAVAQLRSVLEGPQASPFADDPTVVVVVLGYADPSGDADTNLKISLQRAESVVQLLRDSLGLQNLTHAVGMGGSNFLDPAQAAKNRAAEVWVVLP